jgi:acyl-CoA synthetase (AMP-forming)/AMP-acid ligase II
VIHRSPDTDVEIPDADVTSFVLEHAAERGEIPKAFVVPADDGIDPDELIEWVGAQVAPQKRIRLVEAVEEIPRSPSGKILRRVLVARERAAAGGAHA